MSESKTPGLVAMALGAAGLIPFVAGPVLVVTDQAPIGTAIFFTYSMVIASFLGGTWWGRALLASPPPAPILVLSNVLVLAAWSSFWFGTPAAQAAMLSAVYAALLAGEFLLPGLAGSSRDYRILRTVLTVVVIACHLAMAMLA
ncbi:MAG: DUF3429 domain-containing protein [Gammaproteobacteria bacterium]|nr:DUF3429 domain-containing protein [Gammaproteobacteria bacterium]